MKVLYIMFALFLMMNVAYGEDKKPSIKIKYLKHEQIKNHLLNEIRDCINLEPFHPKNFIYLSNFPIKQKIKMVIKRPLTDLSSGTLDEFEIDENGNMGRVSFMIISSKGFLPGERIIVNFSTKDEKFSYEQSFIPNPIIVHDSNGKKRLSAELMMYKPAFYKLELFGIKDNEKLTLKSISGNEKINTQIEYKKADRVAVSPDTITEMGGVGRYSIIHGSNEPIEFNLPWGIEFIKYVKGEKVYQVKNPKNED